MKFKFPAWVSFFGAFLAGLVFIQTPQQSVSIAAPIPEVASDATPALRRRELTLSEGVSFRTPSTGQEQIDCLGKYDVIYLGENHDRPEHHATELAIITQLHQESSDRHKQLVVAWEMFQRPFQPILDRYLAGTISEAQLREQTEYDSRWGFDWEFYAPILRYAQAQQIPLVALNTPTEITRKVAEDGIDSLQRSDFRYIPPRTEIMLDNLEYRQKMAEIYQSHVEAEEGNSRDRDNFFAAQVLWDETMADGISRYYQTYPQSQIVVLVGKAHIADDYAIPNRVARRIINKPFAQTSLLLDN